MGDSSDQEIPERRGLTWSVEEERRLYDAFRAGVRMAEIAAVHDRTTGGIRAHLQVMGLVDIDGATVDPPPEFAPTPAAQKRAEKAAAKAALRPKSSAAQEETSAAPAEINPRFAEALSVMDETEKSVFITGKAGTGKSTLLKHFRRHTKKNVVVLAPTGIAALNVGGQTIHNFFHFQIDVTPQKVAAKKKPRNARLYKKIDMIVIDEISMVRADIMDCVETFLCLHGPHPGQVFGGVQMIFIGDLYQLPPVVGAQDRQIFSDHYQTPYFFSAHALRDIDLPIIELEKVYRQKDRAFVGLLNRVRENHVSDADIGLLNSRVDVNAAPDRAAFSISLTATNQRADEINREHLSALPGKMYETTARVAGDFGREYFPASPELAFKVGAQVMMLNNDKEGRWVNGSIGVIEAVRSSAEQGDYVTIRLQDQDEPVMTAPHTWEVYHFALAENQIQSEPVGTFTQYPFRLAWAVTIHKSQGKTFNRVTIDIGRGAFAAGQVYVALSRCTSFEGITLKTPIQRRHIQTDPRIHAFMAGKSLASLDDATDEMSQDAPDCKPAKALPPTPAMLIEIAIRDKAPLEILYLKGNDERTLRTVYPRALGPETHKDQKFLGMKAFCMQSNEEKLFSVDRILQIVSVRG